MSFPQLERSEAGGLGGTPRKEKRGGNGNCLVLENCRFLCATCPSILSDCVYSVVCIYLVNSWYAGPTGGWGRG